MNLARKIFSAVMAAIILVSLNFCEASRKIIAVMPLENVSGYEEQKVAEIMTEQLIVALHSSGSYTVVERTQMGTILKEQEFQNIAVEPSKAIELGKIIGADYSMIGKVTMAMVDSNPTADTVARLGELIGLEEIGLEELGAAADKYVHKFKGKIMLEFRFVNNTTGEIILAKTVEGSKSGSNEVNAFNNACKQAAENFLREIDSLNPFVARVADIDGENIYIDQGSENGLRCGEKLTVSRESSPIIVNGKVVGMKKNEIGKVKVIEVNLDYAICKVDDKKMDVQKGDVVRRG